MWPRRSDRRRHQVFECLILQREYHSRYCFLNQFFVNHSVYGRVRETRVSGVDFDWRIMVSKPINVFERLKPLGIATQAQRGSQKSLYIFLTFEVADFI